MCFYKCKHGVFTAFTHILRQERGLVTCITLHPEIMEPSSASVSLPVLVLFHLTLPWLALLVYLGNKLAKHNRKKSKRGQCASTLGNSEIYGSLKARWGERRRSWWGARKKKRGASTRMRERIQCFGIFLFFPWSTGCFLSPAPPGGLQKRVIWCKLHTRSVFVQCSPCKLRQPLFRASVLFLQLQTSHRSRSTFWSIRLKQ